MNLNTLQWRTKVGGSKRIRYPRRPINYIKRWALNCIKTFALNLQIWACSLLFGVCSPVCSVFRTYLQRVTFSNVYTWFSELCAHLVRCKHQVYWLDLWSFVGPCWVFSWTLIWCEARFRHALTAEMSETFPSGGSMHASVKLEGIDGRAPQERVEHVA